MLEFLSLWNRAPLLASILLLSSPCGDTAVSSCTVLPDSMLLPGGFWMGHWVSASLAACRAELNRIILPSPRAILSTRGWLLHLTKGAKSWLSPFIARTTSPDASTSRVHPQCSGARGHWHRCALMDLALLWVSRLGPDCLYCFMSGSAGLSHGARSCVRHPGILGQCVSVRDRRKSSLLYPVSFSQCCEINEKCAQRAWFILSTRYTSAALTILCLNHTVLELWILSGLSPSCCCHRCRHEILPLPGHFLCACFRVSCKRAHVTPLICSFKAWIPSFSTNWGSDQPI